MIWEKTGGSVEVVVIREKSGERMQLMLNVNDTLQENFYGYVSSAFSLMSLHICTSDFNFI